MAKQSLKASAALGPAVAARPAAAVPETCRTKTPTTDGVSEKVGTGVGRHPRRRRTLAHAPAAAAPDYSLEEGPPQLLRTTATPAKLRASGASAPEACSSPPGSLGIAHESGGSLCKEPTAQVSPAADATPRRSPRHQASQHRSPRTASPDTPPANVSPTAAAAAAAARLANGDWFDPLDPGKVRKSVRLRVARMHLQSIVCSAARRPHG